MLFLLVISPTNLKRVFFCQPGKNCRGQFLFSRFDPTCVFSKENSQELESEYENGHSNKISRFPIRSQRCTSFALLGVQQESSQRGHRAWKLNSEFTPENIPSHKERIVFQPSLFQGYKLAVKLPGGVCKSKFSNPHLFVSR